MKFFTKWLTVIVLVLSLFVVAACQEQTPTETPEPTVETPVETPEPTDEVDPIVALLSTGYYEYFVAGASRHVYAHFYTNGIWYIDALVSQNAGFYEIVEEAMTENVNGDPVDANMQIVLKDFKGEVLFALGYNSTTNIIYNNELWYGNQMTHAPAKVAADYADEVGIPMYNFHVADNDLDNIQIMHNGTFQDVTGMYIDGTWTLEGTTYTLISDDVTGTYTLAIAQDYLTAVLTKGTETLDLVIKEEELVLVHEMTGEAIVNEQYNVTGQFVLRLYEGAIAELTITAMGNASTTRKTWMIGEDQTLYVVGFGGSGNDVNATPDDKGFYTFDMIVEMDGGATVTVPMTNVPAVTELVAFTSAAGFTLKLYSDNTVKVFHAQAGDNVIKSGTWSYATYVLTVTFDGEDPVNSSVNTTEMTIVLSMPAGGEETMDVTFTSPNDEWGPALQS